MRRVSRSSLVVCAGRFDPQRPVGCAEERVPGIPGACLAIFERSGHYPFVEEPERISQAVVEFLSKAAS